MNKFDRITIGVIIANIFYIILTIIVVFRKSDSEKNLIKEMERIEQNIKNGYRQIDSLNNSIELKHDTIRLIEKRKETIINNYYKNEKVILTADDSTNNELRKRNQLLFEQRYFSGRYNPKVVK
jgi:hypothetical protein